MMVLVAYDVSTVEKAGQRRLSRVAKTCLNYGQRVQNSVFECIVTPDQWVQFRRQLIDEIDESTDSLRFYFLGTRHQEKIEHIGAKPSVDLEGPLII